MPADGLDAKQVAELIDRNVNILESLISELSRLAKQIAPAQQDYFDHLSRQYRFTVTEQNQLKRLLLRWRVLTDHRPLVFDSAALKKGKDVLRWLERQVNAVEAVL